jgi:hypothetical protein
MLAYLINYGASLGDGQGFPWTFGEARLGEGGDAEWGPVQKYPSECLQEQRRIAMGCGSTARARGN